MNNGADFALYLEIIAYPVIGLFIIEMISRAAKIANWVKLLFQAVMCVLFGIAYMTLQFGHWITGIVLIALAIALFYQSKVSKLHPEKTMY